MEKSLLLAGALLATACVDIKEDTGTTETTDTSTTEDTEEAWAPAVSVDWASDAVTLTFENQAEGGMYYWGITENSGACVDAGECWTGEDCFMGYDLASGDNLLFCHPLGSTGVTLAYGATGANTVEGETTTFNMANADYSAVTTHILDDRSSADAPCWTWGVDESYYSGYEKSCSSM